MAIIMKPEFLSALHEAEKEILSRTEQLFRLAESSTSFQEIISGYQEVVDLIGKKYIVYYAELDADKSLSAEKKQQKEEEFQKQYTAELAQLAVVIDRIRGVDIS